MNKIGLSSVSCESFEEQSNRTALSVLRECKAGRLANTIAAVKLFALSLLPNTGCNEGGSEDYIDVDSVEIIDFADITDSDSYGEIDVAPDASMSCDSTPHDGEYKCKDGYYAVGVLCGDEYTPVDVCIDDVQAIIDECAVDSITPLHVNCWINSQCALRDFDGLYGCNDGCHATGMICREPNGEIEFINVNLCGGETPLVCPDGSDSVEVHCR